MTEDQPKIVDDLDPLPTAEEAELGELCRVPSGQFDQCKLVDDQTAPLLGFLEEERNSEAATEGGILAEIEAEFDNLTEGEN